MARLIAVLWVVVAAAAAAADTPAAPGVGPDLQAAANFGQTWDPVVFDAARALADGTVCFVLKTRTLCSRDRSNT